VAAAPPWPIITSMNQTDLSAALVVGKVLRVMLKDNRTLQGTLEESQIGADGAPCYLKFRSALNLEPKSHYFSGPDDVRNVEVIPEPAAPKRR